MENLKKIIKSSGINGSFEGIIEIHWNVKKETKKVHNAVTHDEENRTFFYHQVIGKVLDYTFISPEFHNENLVWQNIDEVESKISTKLHLLANVPKQLSLKEQLQEKGFQPC